MCQCCNVQSCNCTAGVFCAIVSHPADTIVSKLNQNKGSSVMEVAGKVGFKGEFFLIYLQKSKTSMHLQILVNWLKKMASKMCVIIVK